MNDTKSAIAAVIAAAGSSRRMGDFKQLLPWGPVTVIEAVVDHLQAAGAYPVLCVVGHRGDDVAAALAGTAAQIVHNADHARIDMLRSYQVGVRSLVEDGDVQIGDETASNAPIGALLALGDQPHIPVEVIARIIEQARQKPGAIVVPSYQMRRGHPIFLPRRFWPDLLALHPEQSLRDLLHRFEQAIYYVDVDTDAIRRDMDTPAEYGGLLEAYVHRDRKGI